jgi:hypothetical protein
VVGLRGGNQVRSVDSPFRRGKIVRFTGFVVGIALVGAAARPLRAQAEPDPGQPRPPLLLEASRTERLDTAVRMYLADLIGAIQRGDTVALASLVPDELVRDVEKSVAVRALACCRRYGCTSTRGRHT